MRVTWAGSLEGQSGDCGSWIVDRGSWIVDVKKMLRCLLAWLGWVGMRRRLDSDIPGAASG